VEVGVRESLSSGAGISIRFSLRCRLRTKGVRGTNLPGGMHAINAEISKVNDVHQAVEIRVTSIPIIEFSDAAIGIFIPEGLRPCSSVDLQTGQSESLRCWLSG
jgi:hypothetical protein